MNLPWTDKKPGESELWNLTPNAPFYLMHHPTGWALNVEEGFEPEFLPTFSTMFEIPGVNGVRQTRTGGDSALARTEAQDRGYTILDRDLGYVARWRCQNGGYHYENIYAVPKKLGNSVIWKTDTKGWNAFRRSLLENGEINPPDVDQLEFLIEREERNAERFVRDQHIPEIGRKLQEIRDRVENMKSAIESIKKPKKRGKK